MLRVDLAITGGDTRTLCYTDTIDTARRLVYDYTAVRLDSDNRATVAALNGRIPIGTWTTTETESDPAMVNVTWIGPNADTSVTVEAKHFPDWLATRLEALIVAHPDAIGFAGDIGSWIGRDPTATVRRELAKWAAASLATSLLAGNQHVLARNLIHVWAPTLDDPTIEDPHIDESEPAA
ncbi:MAG: hypothetical protein LBV00_11415 [Propionibacteriaceae bacterium]|jgi:hypothetical protein|nr:hypothetical protein [Propionibacteriaceae bacterium]